MQTREPNLRPVGLVADHAHRHSREGHVRRPGKYVIQTEMAIVGVITVLAVVNQADCLDAL